MTAAKWFFFEDQIINVHLSCLSTQIQKWYRHISYLLLFLLNQVKPIEVLIGRVVHNFIDVQYLLFTKYFFFFGQKKSWLESDDSPIENALQSMNIKKLDMIRQCCQRKWLVTISQVQNLKRGNISAYQIMKNREDQIFSGYVTPFWN